MIVMLRLREGLVGLNRRSPPHYGQLLLVIVLGFAMWSCQSRMGAYYRELREAVRTGCERSGEVATVLSFLPYAILENEQLLQLCGWVFNVAALLWLSQVFLPWSSWLSAASFTAVLALHWENTTKLSHNMHAVNMFMIILALWYGLYTKEIRAALADGRFWTTPLCPGWMPALCVFYLGVVYGAAGLAKVSLSGLEWVNGVSLQLWVFLFGRERPLAEFVLSRRDFAVALQAVTLAAEIAALAAIFWRHLRIVIGLVLIGFHLGSTLLIGIPFVANVILLALVFLPAREAIDGFVRRRLRPAVPFAGVRSATIRGRLRVALRSRLNVFGQWQPASTNCVRIRSADMESCYTSVPDSKANTR